MQIWKFWLEIPNQPVEMPQGAIVLDAAIVDGKMYVWALVDTGVKKVQRDIRVYNTGRDVPSYMTGRKFIRTLIATSGIVWHVFDGGEVSA